MLQTLHRYNCLLDFFHPHATAYLFWFYHDCNYERRPPLLDFFHLLVTAYLFCFCHDYNWEMGLMNLNQNGSLKLKWKRQPILLSLTMINFRIVLYSKIFSLESLLKLWTLWRDASETTSSTNESVNYVLLSDDFKRFVVCITLDRLGKFKCHTKVMKLT